MAALQNKGTIEEPLVSVIVPVYNSQEYLYECIESLMAQTLKSAEFIFVDDGSTDNSVSIIREYQVKDPRVVLLHQEHGGAGPARNMGINQAKGKYIAFLDSDDLFLPNTLEVSCTHAEQYNSDLTLFSGSEFSTDKENARRLSTFLNYDYLPDFEPFSSSSWPKYIFQTSGGQPVAKLIRKSLIDKNHIEFPALPRTEDVPFSNLVLALAERITYIKESLFLYRRIEGSGSLEESKDRNPTTFCDAIKMCFEKLEELGLLNSLRQSEINYSLIACYYNLRTMKTLEGFAAAYDCVKNQLIPYLGISFDNREYFYHQVSYDHLKALVESRNYSEFLLGFQNELDAQKKKTAQAQLKNKKLQDEINGIRASSSYRIGRAITWLPRKIRGIIKK